MHTLNTELDLEAMPIVDFWDYIREFVAGAGPDIDQHTAAFHTLFTAERCGSIDRIKAMTDPELAWLVKRKRLGSPVKVYRVAEQGHLTGFRYHTNQVHAFVEAALYEKPQMLTGFVNVDQVLLRIEEKGQRIVMAFPQNVRVEKVDKLTRKEAA